MSLRDPWGTIKCTNIHIMGIQGLGVVEEEEKGREILKKQWLKTTHTFEEKHKPTYSRIRLR